MFYWYVWFVEACKGTTVRLNAGVLTNVVEMWRCEGAALVVNTKISTLQLDLCKKLEVQFTKKELYHSVVWAGIHDLALRFHDAPEHDLVSGYPQMQALHPELNERTGTCAHVFRLYVFSSSSSSFLSTEETDFVYAVQISSSCGFWTTS